MEAFNGYTFEEVWDLLRDTPVTEDSYEIDEDFLTYTKGTELYGIWHDIEDHYDMSIGAYLNGH